MKTVGILLLLLGGILLSYGQTQQERMLIHFDSNEDRLGLFEMRKLDQLLAKIPEDQPVEVMINGHTDAVGSDTYNQRLSERRVAAVKDYLFSKRPELKLIEASGFSEFKPVKSNKTDEGRAANRRVELFVRFKLPEAPVEIAKAEIVDIPEVPMKNIHRYVGGKGTELLIPGGAFGEEIEVEDLEITFKEYFDIYEMMLEGLHLRDNNGNLLESAGMTYITATLDGQRVEPTGEIPLEIRLPIRAVRGGYPERFQLYNLNSSNLWELDNKEAALALEGNYLVGQTRSLGWKNGDTIVCPCDIDIEPVVTDFIEIKVRRTKDAEVFLMHNEKNSFAKLQQTRPKFHKNQYKVSRFGLVPTVVAFVKRAGGILFVEVPINLLKYKKRKNRYIIRKRDFKPFDM